jgi:serine/threonine protein kinase
MPNIISKTTMQHYETLELLGKGTYGKVYKIKDRRNNEIKAIKKCRMTNEKEGIPCSSLREVDRCKKLVHPNIVKLEEVFIQNGKLCIIFEFMSMDLHQYIVNRSRVSRSKSQEIVRQILVGLDFCHRKGTLHRDLKP